ncbi:MAG: glycogen/starch/alpha-glucan phosphorylase [Proteobacteria bacterium]|nr:glycogen/starch/alpha-glucan phosphorylase [Pseudomonadota bacterium]MBU0965496.1 glycogen/starch/alpha-glucan phosphorylase [Pseudomonadota bacterium]
MKNADNGITQNQTYSTIFSAKTAEQFKERIKHHLMSFQGRDPMRAGPRDVYKALSYALRDVLVEKWIETQKNFYAKKSKRVYYLSLEFLVGRTLGNTLINTGLMGEVSKALEQLGYDLEAIREMEEDAALGNGGLGRLAACFMDSVATLKIPAYGYGIRYEYGLFYQKLVNGYQVETPDNWLRYGTPWEFERASYLFPVHFYGKVYNYLDRNGNYRSEWVDTEDVMAMACDILVPGFNNGHVINMRLWTAKASRELDLSIFNAGDYIQAVQGKVTSETIAKVLYPSDEIREGQELRLKQQYFFVAATFQDILRRYKKKNISFDQFSNQIAVQLNDTHPAIAIPELMRILLDNEGLSWEKAWDISTKTFAYTNHTLMPEALETWPVDLIGRVLPRHLQIIYEINQRFLDQLALQYPGDTGKLRHMSIIAEGETKRVRMAHLAIVGSHSVNGVAELHTHLLKTRIFSDFHELYPGKFNNKTNGITPRRWLLKCNAALAALISGKIGHGWVTDLDELRKLEEFAKDPAFQKKWRTVKLENKKRLARIIGDVCGVKVNPDTMFDVQVKRIHEYKRQLLNALHVIALYHRIISEPEKPITPRAIIFAGKAAPSYRKAKLIIKLISSIGEVVNNDPRVGEKLKVVFIPNYNVSLAEKIIPAADLSEQISTAGTEASGTGNMKFSLNGALTVGTLDGANIEILEEVGKENIFIFGLTASEAEYEKQHKSRTPAVVYERNAVVKRIVDSIRDGVFSYGDREIFRPLVDDLLNENDPYLLLLDLESYLDCQEKIDFAFRDKKTWTEKSILNVARMGKFSSDRTIREYARDIWGIKDV